MACVTKNVIMVLTGTQLTKYFTFTCFLCAEEIETSSERSSKIQLSIVLTQAR